jgi:hypothetical protein
VGSINNLKTVRFRIIEKKPMKKAVIIERLYVAKTFSNHDFLEKLPIIKSRDVLAINGPLKLPLNDRRAGIISNNARKLLNGKIRIESTNPAKRSPTIETISEGKVSLTIVPLES